MGPKQQPAQPEASTSAILDAILDPKACEAIAKALSPFITKLFDEYLTSKLEDMNDRMRMIENENEQLKVTVREQAQRIEDIEVYTRCDQLIVRGLAENSYAERASASAATDTATHVSDSVQAVENTFINFCKDRLNVSVSAQDISIIHRLKAGANDPVRPIIVRFTNKKIRNNIYSAKKRLKGSTDRIFITEHLTKHASNLFYLARQLLKEKKIFGCWTTNGQIYVKFSPDPTTRPSLVRTKEDLHQR
jgi:predicted ribosome quality control (RQC) complex YloA/Tae2 family protein